MARYPPNLLRLPFIRRLNVDSHLWRGRIMSPSFPLRLSACCVHPLQVSRIRVLLRCIVAPRQKRIVLSRIKWGHVTPLRDSHHHSKYKPLPPPLLPLSSDGSHPFCIQNRRPYLGAHTREDSALFLVSSCSSASLDPSQAAYRIMTQSSAPMGCLPSRRFSV